MKAELVLECDRICGTGRRAPGDLADDLGKWLYTQIEKGQSARVTVRVEIEEKPARVPWPSWLPDVTRVWVGHTHSDGTRCVELSRSNRWLGIAWCQRDDFGQFPANESRIAKNVNGFVELSECES